jgi:hypothetical protein
MLKISNFNLFKYGMKSENSEKVTNFVNILFASDRGDFLLSWQPISRSKTALKYNVLFVQLVSLLCFFFVFRYTRAQADNKKNILMGHNFSYMLLNIFITQSHRVNLFLVAALILFSRIINFCSNF